MTALAALPPAIAVAVAVLVVAGAAFALIGSIGLVRLGSFYERIHPPTLGTTFGTLLIALASIILFSTLEARPVIRDLVLVVFVAVTTPITFTLLVRAATLRGSDGQSDESAVSEPKIRGRDATGGLQKGAAV